MLSPPLIRHQVIQVRESSQKRLLVPTGMMESLHRKEFPPEGVVRLIPQRTGGGASAGR
jgi:hypothetical protein